MAMVGRLFPLEKIGLLELVEQPYQVILAPGFRRVGKEPFVIAIGKGEVGVLVLFT